jgi:hypothetical protein
MNCQCNEETTANAMKRRARTYRRPLRHSPLLLTLRRQRKARGSLLPRCSLHPPLQQLQHMQLHKQQHRSQAHYLQEHSLQHYHRNTCLIDAACIIHNIQYIIHNVACMMRTTLRDSLPSPIIPSIMFKRFSPARCSQFTQYSCASATVLRPYYASHYRGASAAVVTQPYSGITPRRRLQATRCALARHPTTLQRE